MSDVGGGQSFEHEFKDGETNESSGVVGGGNFSSMKFQRCEVSDWFV